MPLHPVIDSTAVKLDIDRSCQKKSARPHEFQMLPYLDDLAIREHPTTCHNKFEGLTGQEQIRTLHTEIMKGIIELQRNFRAAAARKSIENVEELANSRHAAWIQAADRKAAAEEAVKIPDVIDEIINTRGKKGTLEALYEECNSNNRTLRIALASREAEIRQMTQQVVTARRPRANLVASAAEIASS